MDPGSMKMALTDVAILFIQNVGKWDQFLFESFPWFLFSESMSN